ncbi:hypothetical protein HY612_02835, partial [Candidatus Roizmanbacteria bacterium]|nr:hypothetical protein [Candidatus Roizmanbacteria bacterium]
IARKFFYREAATPLAVITFKPSEDYLSKYPGSYRFRDREVLLRAVHGKKGQMYPQVFLEWIDEGTDQTDQFEAIKIDYYTREVALAEIIVQGLESANLGRSYFVGPHYVIRESFNTEGKPSYQLALDEENVGIWLQTRKKRIR